MGKRRKLRCTKCGVHELVYNFCMQRNLYCRVKIEVLEMVLETILWSGEIDVASEQTAPEIPSPCIH